MDQFPPNSQRARAQNEPKKIERVTSAEAVRRKRGLGRRLKETFIIGDARGTADFVIVEVMIPAARDMIFDAFEAGLQRLVYGESTRRRNSGAPAGYNSNVGHVDYRGMGMNRTQAQARAPQPRMLSRRSRARGGFDELIIPSRREAEEVIDRMFDILSRYGGVSVADLYELTGVQSSHTDMKWGWIALRGAKAVPLRQGGFLLDLPEPEPFD